MPYDLGGEPHHGEQANEPTQLRRGGPGGAGLPAGGLQWRRRQRQHSRVFFVFVLLVELFLEFFVEFFFGRFVFGDFVLFFVLFFEFLLKFFFKQFLFRRRGVVFVVVFLLELFQQLVFGKLVFLGRSGGRDDVSQRCGAHRAEPA